MPYFGGLRFLGGTEAPQCCVWIERDFPYYALNYAASGTVRWRLASGRRVTLPTPAVFWTWPGQEFAYGCRPGEHWHQHFVSFSGPRAGRLQREGLLPQRAQPWIRLTDPTRFGENFRTLLHLIQQPGAGREHAIHLMEGMLLGLMQPLSEPASDPQFREGRGDAVIAELCDAIRQEPRYTPDFDAAAKRAGYSLVQFRRKFKQRAGLPPTAFVIHCRMQRAAHHLATTDLQAQEVAREAGYDDPFHFHKVFRQHFGMTPLNYRREMRTLTG